MRIWALTLTLVALTNAPFPWTPQFPWELQALAVAPAELARVKAGETIVSDVPVNEGGSLKAVFFVAGPLAVAREVLWDQERFVEFVPDVKAVKVLERHPNRQLVEITGGRGPVSVSYVADRTLEARRIVWKSVRGDVKRNDGSWTLEPAPGGTLVTYQVHVVPKGPVPGYVVGYLQKQALTGLIGAIRKRIEAKAAKR